MSSKKWRFAVDRGGTFTDVVALAPDGGYHTLKLLSSSPEYKDPSIEGVRRVLGLPAGALLPAGEIEAIRLGTTVATNALLERKGGPSALVITRGFGDLLEIGSQARPDIFSLDIEKPEPLYSEVIEVTERIGPDGEVVEAFDRERLTAELSALKGKGIESVAVVLMHSWKNPAHELLSEILLKEAGFPDIHLSHRCVNLIKMVTRGRSTMVDAYLSTVLGSYVENIRSEACGIPIEFIESSGGLSDPDGFHGKNAILSGPAGGVIAVGSITEEARLKGSVGFDMGGTSTDVSRYDGGPGGGMEKVYEGVVAGLELQLDALSIVTVASGGGSILTFDGERMKVGPESAGARPGPAAYGIGGPLTITDANLLTGRLVPEFFPLTFGPDGDKGLYSGDAARLLDSITGEINTSLGTKFTAPDAALGFIDIANEKMALAIREVSVSKGYDVRDYALLTFGGAGGQHACAIASLLGMGVVISHPLGGVMSAYGIGLSKPSETLSRTVLTAYDGDDAHRKLTGLFDEMEASVRAEAPPGLDIKREADIRPRGSDSFITVPFTECRATLSSFKESYRLLYGFYPEGAALEVVNLRLTAVEDKSFFASYVSNDQEENSREPEGIRKIYYAGGEQSAPVYLRANLPTGFEVDGPALIIDPYSTLVVDPGFRAYKGAPPGEEDKNGSGVIYLKSLKGKFFPERGVSHREGQVKIERDSAPDPALLEVMANLFSSIATEMGHTLANTAFSVNIKERLDFSCAVFDSSGALVANAPHIPVHLGSMSDTVAAVREEHADDMRPGDVYLTNNPYRGGSHLPDITVVRPVFSKDGELIFFTAARGHHADIGGVTPGSMPPEATHIDEEGVLIDSLLILRDGKLLAGDITSVLTNHRFPARNLSERILDIKAQVAACERGAEYLSSIVERYGLSVVTAYMGHIQANAESAVKRALAGFLAGKGSFESTFEDFLDDGTPIKVRIAIDGGPSAPESLTASVDFTGTGPEHKKDSLNAPLSVVRSAVLYVLRAIISEDIPLNSGCMRTVNIVMPKGTVLSPSYPAPVSSGNVETSQRVVDALLGALGVAAASQGTMNNLLFEVDGEAPYYETIGGGAGATGTSPGASGVQVHMTNTRITDPEILEVRHPGVRLKRFSIRRGSGGAGGEGGNKGGDGLVRELQFLKPAKVTLVSERRVTAPYGLNGGVEGERGEDTLKRASSGGEVIKVPNRSFLELQKGDILTIKTPGGGGFGNKR